MKENNVEPLKTIVLLLALLAYPVILRADSIDDAEAKRRGVSVETVQLEQARTRIAVLEKQVADLSAQLKAAQNGAATQPTVVATQKKPFVPLTTFTKRATPSAGSKLSPSDAKMILDRARQTDAAITAYLRKHDVSDAMANAMYAGQPKPGMTEEQAKTFGFRMDAVGGNVDTLNGKSINFLIYGGGNSYRLIINNEGVIVSVEDQGRGASVGEVGGYIQNIGGQIP